MVDVRPHWWYLAGPVSVLAVVIAGSAYGWVNSMATVFDWLTIVALVLAALWLTGRYLKWANTRLIVTNSRLVERKGVLGRRGREIPLSALTDIGYHQTIFERIIGAGDVLLESAGRDGREVFPDLPHPAAIQNEIHAQADACRRRIAGPGPVASIPEQIDQLDRLRRRGVISDQEFASKKAQLLDRL